MIPMVMVTTLRPEAKVSGQCIYDNQFHSNSKNVAIYVQGVPNNVEMVLGNGQGSLWSLSKASWFPTTSLMSVVNSCGLTGYGINGATITGNTWFGRNRNETGVIKVSRW